MIKFGLIGSLAQCKSDYPSHNQWREREGKKSAALAAPRVKVSKEDIAKALTSQ